MQLPDLLNRSGTKNAPQSNGVRSSMPDLLNGYETPKLQQTAMPDLIQPPEKDWWDRNIGAVKNFTSNFATLIGLGDPQQNLRAGEAFKARPELGDVLGKLTSDATQWLSIDKWKGLADKWAAEDDAKIAAIKDSPLGYIKTQLYDKASSAVDATKNAAKSVMDLPLMMVSIPNDFITATSGVSLLDPNVRAVNTDEAARATKSTVANVVAILAGAGISSKLSSMELQSTAKELGATLGSAADLAKPASEIFTNPNVSKMIEAGANPTLGKMGRTIQHDALVGAGSGAAYGATDKFGEDDMLTSAVASGIMFATLGAATGRIKMLKDAYAESRGKTMPVDAVEALRMQAGAYAETAQANALVTMQTRLMQANTEKSITNMVDDIKNVAANDAPIQAVVASSLERGRAAVVRGIEASDGEAIKALKGADHAVHVNPDGTVDVLSMNGDPYFADRKVNPIREPVTRVEDVQKTSEVKNLDGSTQKVAVFDAQGKPLGNIPKTKIERTTVKTEQWKNGDVVQKVEEKKIPYDKDGNRITRRPNADGTWDNTGIAEWRTEPYIAKGVVRLQTGKAPYIELQGHEALDGTPIKSVSGATTVLDGWSYAKVQPPQSLGLTAGERAAVKAVFERTGELPQIGTLADQAEFGSYLGKDYLVRKKADGTYNLLNPSADPKSLNAVLMNVPAEKVLVRDAALADMKSPTETYDNIFAAFQRQLTDNPNAPFLENVAQTAARFGMQDQIKPLTIELGRRYKATLDLGLDDFTKQRYEANLGEVKNVLQQEAKKTLEQISEPVHLADQLSSKANANGMYVQDNGVNYELRHIETDEVLYTGKSLSEGIKFVERSGQEVGITLDPESKIPSDGGNLTPRPPWTGKTQFGETGGFAAQNAARDVTTQAKLEAGYRSQVIKVPWYTSTAEMFASIDMLFGTELGRLFEEPLRTAKRVSAANTSNGIKAFEPLRKKLLAAFPTAEKMTQAARVQEAIGVNEMKQKGGIFDWREMTRSETQLAEFAAENQVDMSRILKYRRERTNLLADGLRDKAAQAAQQIEAQYGNAIIDDSVKKQLIEMQQKVAESSPAFKQGMQALDGKYQLNPAEQEVFSQLERLSSQGLNEGSIYGVFRYAQALRDPKMWGQSRAEMAAEFGFTPEQLKLLEEVDGFYSKWGATFGVSEKRMLNHYMNRIKSNVDMFSDDDVLRIASQFDNPRTAKATFDMIRTGEMSDFSLDLTKNMEAYIRAGYKKDIYKLYSAQLEPALKDALAKIQKEGRTNGVKFAKHAEDWLQDYYNRVVGQPYLPDKMGEEGFRGWLVRTFGKDKVKLTSSITSDAISIFTQTITSASMGGRWGMGLRDGTAGLHKYYAAFGADRALAALQIKVTPTVLKDLVDKGVVYAPSANAWFNPGEEGLLHRSKLGPLADRMSKVNQTMFSWSLQDKVYILAQASTYLESVKFSGPVFNDVMAGKMPIADAFKKLNMSFLDDRVAKQIDVILNTHGAQAAAEFYGKEVAQISIGMFGSMEQPRGWNGKVGRLLGMYGQYPTQDRRFYANLFTRGTPSEIAGRAARLATSNAAMYVAGRGAGFDMMRWLEIPTNALFFGGPIVSMLGDANNLLSTVGADDSKRQYTLNRVRQYFPRSWEKPQSIFAPGSYQAGLLLDSYRRMDRNDETRGFIEMLTGAPPSDETRGVFGK